jgi:hypothetical protein
MNEKMGLSYEKRLLWIESEIERIFKHFEGNHDLGNLMRVIKKKKYAT